MSVVDEARAAVRAYLARVGEDYDDPTICELIHVGALADDDTYWERLVHDALLGDDMANDIIAGRIERGERLPPVLARYVCDKLRGKLRRKGRRAMTGRDAYIVRALEIADKKGVTPTRSPARKPDAWSGARIVMMELLDRDIPLSEEAIEGLWKRHKRRRTK